MNSERASLKNRRREEIEPCLRADNQSLGVLQDSLPSRLSFIAVKGTDYIGRCVLFLFILAIFLLAVVLAFLVGHWLARNDPFFESTTPSSLNVTTTRNAAVLTITEAVHSNDKENWLEENDEQSLTLLDVYVPSNIEITMWPPLHLATTNNNKKRRNILLTALPRHILPVHYDLLLDLTTFAHSNKIRGNISILLESYGNSTKNEIVFHAASTVHIDRLRVHHEGRPVMIESLHRDYRKKIVRIITKERLRSGWHTLEVQFVTRLCDDDDVSGVHCYRNGAANSKNDNKTLPVISFTTKFEPTLARTFIPCWDEPSVKATFNVSVIHQPTITVLSNMPPYRMQQNKRRRNVITSFHRTPPMSVYLLAFAAGSFMRLETSTQRNIPLTIWTLREDFIHARFAANFSPSMFDKHEREFEIKYPLPKLDFVVARSFPVGGMENWGLIIFHNDMILLDSFLEDYVNMTVDLMAERFKIEKIITHEIAHQWFGNLVTMDDWSEIWLNEGFASFYVHDFLSRDYPNLASSEYYLRLTQLVTRQTMDEKFALVRHLRSESEVENAFDRIHLYTKGCVIVKMMMDLVKEAPFRAGVRRYLKRNAYKAVSRDALWDAMPPFADHGAENLRLEDVIDPWLINEGIPEVVISRNYNEDSVKVTQRASDQNQYVIFLTDVNLNYNEQIHHSNDRLRRDNQNRGNDFSGNMTWSSTLNGHRRKKRPKHSKPTSDGNVGHRRRSQKYRPESSSLRFKNKKLIWPIPVSYQFGSQSTEAGQVTRQFWLLNESMSFVDIDLLPTMPILANPDWKYPYRINYDLDNWKMLAQMLHTDTERIPSKSRIQLLVDAEFYLLHSGVPEVYLYILGYLAKENDMDILLIGLDSLYRFVDMFRGTRVNVPILMYIRPIIAQIDNIMDDAKFSPEVAAAWLVDANRLAELYQLRCATNLPTCEQKDTIEKWLLFADLANGDHYAQMTAVCHHLFVQGGEREYGLLLNTLKQLPIKWSANVHLATCVKDNEVVVAAAHHIVSTKNAAVYISVLQNDYSLHYNRRFRDAFWKEISLMSLDERKLLFSATSKITSQVSRILAHSVRSSMELRQLIRVLPEWSGVMQLNIEYLIRKFHWIDETAVPNLLAFLSKET